MLYYPIPLIPDADLDRRRQKIAPLVRIIEDTADMSFDVGPMNGVLFYAPRLNPRDESFQAVPEKKVRFKTEHLKQMSLKTCHEISAQFSPTEAEVLSQIGESLINRVIAYETIQEFPQPMIAAAGKSFHAAITILYLKP